MNYDLYLMHTHRVHTRSAEDAAHFQIVQMKSPLPAWAGAIFDSSTGKMGKKNYIDHSEHRNQYEPGHVFVTVDQMKWSVLWIEL